MLGSGAGDVAEQTFNLPVRNVTFIPSSASETGVVPDIQVAVGGRFWEVTDLTDVDADGSETFSPTVRDDGTLDLHFRRRLPKGTDNVVVMRHRAGSGPRGNLLPAYSFTKPAARNAVIDAIAQPFPTSGGSDREAVADIRVNAPRRLAANDRAVSIDDFARLARLHASVWQAVAAQAIVPGPGQRVALVIVPADGAALTPTLTQSIVDFVLAKAPPLTTIEIADFVVVSIAIVATINGDTAHYARDKVEDAVRAALLTEFSLRRRRIGQPLFIGEILTAMESVEGASGALAVISAPATQPARVSHAGDGSISAVFPAANQIAYVTGPTSITLTSKAVS